MDTAKRYQDTDGNDCSIWQMVKREPDWAANRIQEGEKAITKLDEVTRSVDFDSKRLRKLGLLFGVSMPESNETLAFAAGSVLGAIHRSAERCFFESNLLCWTKFPDTKPQDQQVCLVAGGPDKHAQILAVRWCQSDEEFYWYDPDLGLDPYPTEATTHWMPFPNDPK